MLVRVKILEKQGGGPWISANKGEVRERNLETLTAFGVSVAAKDISNPAALAGDPGFRKLQKTGEANGLRLLAIYREAEPGKDGKPSKPGRWVEFKPSADSEKAEAVGLEEEARAKAEAEEARLEAERKAGKG